MTGALQGLRIVEFAGIGPAPFCAMMLADHGAEVIRISRPGQTAMAGSDEHDFLLRARRSIAIDLKSPDGLDVAKALCRRSDAVIEGFRPGVMERIGLGPDALMRDNPRLVYGRMTGWGQDGPLACTAGHDINYIALSGALHAIGRRGARPVPPLNLVGDFGAGGLMLAFGVLAALHAAARTGRGQVVDCAMADGSATLMTMIYSLFAQGQWLDRREANLIDGGAPFYDTYETRDGKYLAVGAVEPQFFALLLDRTGLADDPVFAHQHRRSDWPAQKQRLAEVLIGRTRDEWCALFDGTDACVTPVLSLEEAVHHPHNRARGVFTGPDGLQPAPSPRIGAMSARLPEPMAAGEACTEAILAELGYATSTIAALRAAGTVA